VATFFASTATERLSLDIFSIIGLAVESAHCHIFIRGRGTANVEAAQTARTAILDDSIRFAIVKEDKADSDDGGTIRRFQSDVV
jgi:hypothetical protein